MKRLFTMLASLALCAVLLLCYTSCALTVGADDLTEGYTRTAADVTLTDDQKTAGQTAYNGFAFRLLTGAVRDPDSADQRNRMISPLSAMMCLAMLANGAGGNTKTQMEAALGLPVGELNAFLFDYWQTPYDAEDCRVLLADSIWFRDEAGRLTVEPAFLQTVADWYGAQAYAAPFDKTTVRDINNWCAQKTDGMIKEIIQKIDADAVMYLINALTFDAKWAKQYEKSDVRDAAFTNADGTSAQVQMLYSHEDRYLSGDGFEGFARPYKGGRYEFVGLLPAEGTDIWDFAASLDADAWQAVWQESQARFDAGDFGVDAGIPEFTFDFEIRLNDVLADMGMTDMFDGGLADFSPMASSSRGNLYCSLVGQKTRIELDRNGTKAAAITWGGVNDECAMVSTRTVILNRPFIFAIVDTATHLPLFLGVVSALG